MNIQKIKLFLLVSLLSLAMVIAAFPTVFEVGHPGYRKIFILAAIWMFITIGGVWSLEKIIKPIWADRTRWERATILWFSAIFSILLVVMVPLNFDHYFNLLLPVHTLEIRPIAPQKDSVDLLSFNVEWGSLPAGKVELPFIWQGKPGANAVVAFSPEAESHLVRVSWDGDEQIIDLSSGVTKAGVLAKHSFERPFYHTLIYTPLLLIALFYIIFWITTMLIAFQTLPGRKKTVKLYWLAFPMLTVWTIYLLTYWPGMSSYDTMQQWREAQAGVFTDAHPAIHTMFIALVSRVFPTPAAIAAIQILVLAWVTAWGLAELNTRGLPAWATWGLAFGFALLPVNSLMIITVWKDILYACAVFTFLIQFAKIAFSNGEWLKNKRNLAGVILSGLAAAFLRHNGFPVILASLLVLFLPYRNQWKGILATIIIISGVFFFVRGPFYDFMKVKKYPGFINILMFDHIGAHIKAGTPIEKDDLTYLNGLIPIEKWRYKCYDSEIRNMDGPIPFDTFTIPDPRPMQIAMKLFLKDPEVDIRHTLCAGGLAWRVDPGNPIYVTPMTYTISLSHRKYVMPNEFGITENPILPSTIMSILPVPQPDDDPVLWRPAFYLLIILFSLPVLALRGRRKELLLIVVPILFQTGVMILVNYAADFRYFFSTELSALLAIGMLFLPLSELQNTNDSRIQANSGSSL